MSRDAFLSARLQRVLGEADAAGDFAFGQLVRDRAADLVAAADLRVRLRAAIAAASADGALDQVTRLSRVLREAELDGAAWRGEAVELIGDGED